MNVIYRQAKADDLAAMIDLLSELFTIEQDFSVNTAKQLHGLRMMLQDLQGQIIVVAELQNKLIGLCTLQRLISTAEGGYVGLVEDVIVSELYRGKGVGTKLLATIEQIAKQRGYKRLQLLCDRNNLDAQAFYMRHDWNTTNLFVCRKYL